MIAWYLLIKDRSIDAILCGGSGWDSSRSSEGWRGNWCFARAYLVGMVSCSLWIAVYKGVWTSNRFDRADLFTIYSLGVCVVLKVLKELIGQRAWMQFHPYIRVLAKMAYYSCTTLAGTFPLSLSPSIPPLYSILCSKGLAIIVVQFCTLIDFRSGLGVQTLGEEYVKIFGVHSKRGEPTVGARLLFVFLHAIAPILSHLSLQVLL